MRALPFRLDAWKVIGIALAAFMGLFIVYPLLSLFVSSFIGTDGQFTLEYFARFFGKKYYLSTLGNSMMVSLTVTAFTVVLGTAMAVALARFRVPGKKLLEILIILTMISPPFIGAYSWILLLGRNGFITNLFRSIGIETPSIYGFAGIVIVFVLKLFPFIYLYVSGAIKSIDSSLEEASASLGAGRMRKLFTVTIPLVIPTLLAGALMVFMNSLADFGTPMLIGEGFRVLPVTIYTEFVGETGGNAAFAGAISIIVVFIATAVFALQKYVVGKRKYTMSALRPPAPEKLKGAAKVLVPLFCFTVCFLGILPQITVVTTSFLKTQGPMFLAEFSLGSYERVFSNLLRPLINTFSLGIVALIVILVVGTLQSYLVIRRPSPLTKILDNLVMFPYIIPGSVLGITILLAFNRQPMILSGTALILIVAYVVRRMPYTIRSGSAILHQIDPSIEEASISLGCPPIKTFAKVVVPMMLPGIISGGILSWITTINELSASVILYTGMTVTLSVATYTEVIRASYGTAAAVSAILTLTTIASLIIFYRISGTKEVNI
jgi:iron(III) transport system permease protein